MTAFDLLCRIIASEVMGENTLSAKEAELDENLISELYGIAKEFDMAHLCGSALKKINPPLLENLLSPFYNEFTLSVFRYRRLADELSQISALFESEGIEHIALKGSVIRGYYPEAWMRTSCDIDILVRKEEIPRARVLLEERLSYKYITECSHDISFESPTGVHLELHFYLLEDFIHLEAQSKILDGIWERAPLADGMKYTRVMTDADLYFYNLAHMAKHFISGGCGVKPFVDLWVLENRVEYNLEQREKLVAEGNLMAFCEAARRLMLVWFFGKEATDGDRIFEKYILSGGIYGTVENKVRIGLAKKQSRISYVLSRIFPSYKTMKNMYPTLEGRKILLPLYHLRRWCRIIFRGGARRAKFQLSAAGRLDEKEIDETARLLNSLGFFTEKQQ